jgi:hypothetical protein
MGIKGGPYADGSIDLRVAGRYAQLLLPPEHPDHLPVEDLDTEELAKGRLRDKNGHFTGRPPKLLPRQIHDAMQAEHYKRVNAVLEESLSDIVKVMRGVAMDRAADPAVRLKAAIYIYERFMGKVPDKIEVDKGSKIDALVDKIMYDVEEAGGSLIEQEIAATEKELAKSPKSRRKPATNKQKRQS